MKKSNDRDCAVCRLVRIYLLAAIPLVAMVGFSSTEKPGDFSKLWFVRVELIDVLAFAALFSLISIVTYRVYDEYYAPRKRKKKLDGLIKDMDKEIKVD